MDEISAQDVSNSIDNSKPHSAPGVDGIFPKFIKLVKPILSPYLASLFNKCIQQEIFPYDFKLAHVIPIPKTLQNLLTNSAQSLCFLFFFFKAFEKISKVRFSDFLAENSMLTSSQFGFRESNSTELVITSFYGKLLNN